MLYVPHLHHEVFLPRFFDDEFGVFNRRANGLFYEEVAALFEERERDFRVAVGRDDDAYRIARRA